MKVDKKSWQEGYEAEKVKVKIHKEQLRRKTP